MTKASGTTIAVTMEMETMTKATGTTITVTMEKETMTKQQVRQ